MPSPFPGMNPFLERPDIWNDFHNSLIPAIRETLTIQIQPRYYVRIEEHLYIHEPTANERYSLGRPDLSLHTNRTMTPASGTVAAVAPVTVGMPALIEEERLPYLEIHDRQKHEVVTVIEVLSPANKASSGREAYLAKVQRILASRTNFVEIDLLRAHEKMPWNRLPVCDYYALVSRYGHRQEAEPRADFWPINLRDPLPTIPIPLKPGESEPRVNLQELLHRVYDAAGYSLFAYEAESELALSPTDAAWVAEILATVRPQE